MPLPVRGIFTYELSGLYNHNIEVGKRVLVQFGAKKLYTAIVYNIHNNKPTQYEVKSILDIIDKHPLVNKFQIRLWEWSSDYYMCSMGEFYKAAIPSGLRLESETKILPFNNEKHGEYNSNEQQVLNALEKNEILNIGEISAITKLKNPIPIIKSLQEKNAIIIQEEVKTRYKAKKNKYIKLHKHIDSPEKILETSALLARAKKQKELFDFYINKHGSTNALTAKPTLKQQLLDESGSSVGILKQLVQKGIFSEVEFEVTRLATNEIETTVKKELNKNQLIAYEQIKKSFEQKDVTLLHGVTSSGKTEIYIHLIDEILKQGKQVLYLLPEIALTSQIIQRLKAVFGNKVGVYHSKFSDSERVEIWNNVNENHNDSYQIILGVRSSIFLPFNNLGLIIVDEEHENTFKQFDPAPRYNARDLSVVLSALHKAKVLLGTATPSLETYYNSKTGRYGLVELFQRHQNIQLPKIMLSDIRKSYKKKEMQAHFSPMMIDNIEDALNKNEQVILFQNRRGFSPFLECNSCGWVPTCKWCDVSLTYHKAINKLICHYCGFSIDSAYRCGHCKEPNLETKGFGTEKVEDEIKLIFPDARVGRLDLDTSRGKHGHETIINNFQNHNIDILIGTQMVSKGLDFEHVSIVGILSADSMLRFPDFRAYERSYQLMAQVSGRAGRKNKQGKVIIQTYDTENVIINQVVHNNYAQMYLHQLKERKQFFYPPFSRLIKLTLKHRDKNTLNKCSYSLANELKKNEHSSILGPTTPAIIRIQNLYIKTIFIKIAKGPQVTTLKKIIYKQIEATNKIPEFKSVQIIIDVDPH